MYLYIKTLDKYTKVRTAGLSEKDESVINKAKEIADKIVNSAKKLDEKHDSIMAKVVDQVKSNWLESANEIFNKNAKILDQELNKTVTELYKKETVNLDLYKSTKIKEFDNLLNEYIEKLGKKILKREINLEDHRKLIADGLERAKANGLFK